MTFSGITALIILDIWVWVWHVGPKEPLVSFNLFEMLQNCTYIRDGETSYHIRVCQNDSEPNLENFKVKDL